jgi:hypothetical protein
MNLSTGIVAMSPRRMMTLSWKAHLPDRSIFVSVRRGHVEKKLHDIDDFYIATVLQNRKKYTKSSTFYYSF